MLIVVVFSIIKIPCRVGLLSGQKIHSREKAKGSTKGSQVSTIGL